MPRLLNILVGIALLLSLAMGGVAHAAEQLCVPSVEATTHGHSEGDNDQAPHGDKDLAHHHGGCHGHHNVVPFDDQSLEFALTLQTHVVEFASTLGASAPPGATLRPPIA